MSDEPKEPAVIGSDAEAIERAFRLCVLVSLGSPDDSTSQEDIDEAREIVSHIIDRGIAAIIKTAV